MLPQFLKDLQSGAAPQACSDPNNIVWKHISAFEETHSKPLECGYSRQEYIALFASMSIRGASYFGKLRSAVKAYATYLVNQGLLSSDQPDIIGTIKFTEVGHQTEKVSKTIYFHSLEELEHAIQETLNASASYDETRFDMAICALYLAWFGFDRNEIAQLLKNDVQKNGILRNGHLIPMPTSVCTILQRYCQAEGYSQQAKGIIFHRYQPSDYLFRSTRLAQITDYSQLTSAINRFKSVLKGKYPLEYDTVRKSGILHRVHRIDLNGELKSCPELQNDLQLAAVVFENALTADQVSDWFEDFLLYKSFLNN